MTFDFSSVRSLISKQNCKKLLEMEEEENLSIKDYQNFLYERHSINTQIIDSRRQSRGEEKKLLDVSAKQKPSVPPWIQSKLSRIRKKFYLNCDIDTATVYSLEVQRAARHFTMTPAETQKWKKRIEKTFKDVKQESKSKNENVPPAKDEEDNKEKYVEKYWFNRPCHMLHASITSRAELCGYLNQSLLCVPASQQAVVNTAD